MRELDVHHDPDEFTKLNKEFHSVLFAKCPNERLINQVHETTVEAEAEESLVAGRWMLQ